MAEAEVQGTSEAEVAEVLAFPLEAVEVGDLL